MNSDLFTISHIQKVWKKIYETGPFVWSGSLPNDKANELPFCVDESGASTESGCAKFVTQLSENEIGRLLPAPLTAHTVAV